MTQEEFKQKIEDVKSEVHDLLMDGGVIYDTALYALLQTVTFALELAPMHTREYNEEFAKIHINKSNQDQS